MDTHPEMVVQEDITPEMDQEELDKAIHSAQRLFLDLLEAFPGLNAAFEAKWDKWQQAISSLTSPSDWSLVPEFDALKALGSKIVPHVVYQVAKNPDDATAIHLYSALEKDTNYLPTTPTPGTSILILNFRRHRLVRNAIADWAEHCDRVSLHSSSGMYTQCEEYEVLLEFGGSIVPRIMLEYCKKQRSNDGPLFWYELLHEIVWGCKTGLRTIFMERQFEAWRGWFEGGEEYVRAPRFSRG